MQKIIVAAALALFALLVSVGSGVARMTDNITIAAGQSVYFADVDWTCTVRARASLDRWFKGDAAFRGLATVCQLHDTPKREVTGTKWNGRYRDVTYWIVMSQNDTRVYWSFPGTLGVWKIVDTQKQPSWKYLNWPPASDNYPYAPVTQFHSLPGPSGSTLKIVDGQAAAFPSGITCARYTATSINPPAGYENVADGTPLVRCSGFHPPGRAACDYSFRVRLYTPPSYGPLKDITPGPTAYATSKTDPGVEHDGGIGSMFSTGNAVNGGNSTWGCP